MNNIIKKAVISEKSMKEAGRGWYTFIVDRNAAKPAITAAIEDRFGVDVAAVKTINMKERVQLQRSRRGSYTIPAYKKAMVALKSGQKIGLFIPEESKEEPAVKEEVKEKKSLLRGTKVKIEKGEKSF